MRLALGWQVSSFTGWGVYGLNLALELAGDRLVEVSSSFPLDLARIDVDPLRRRAIRPFVERSFRSAPADAIAVDALGNDAQGYQLSGHERARAAAIFFELPLSAAAIERLRRYDVVIAGSTWNAEVLRSRGLDHVRTILQGVDGTLFHPCPPGPVRRVLPDRYLVFSGGKAEPRKGQDIVVTAFRAFASRHPDAMLVTAWHSPFGHLAAGMDLDLSGLSDRIIDVGPVANARMPAIYRECDLAVFPSRAEGGTNLVAMEAIACGVPALLSDNTGHKDLLAYEGTYALPQRPHPIDGWGETDPEALLEAMEMAKRCATGHRASRLAEDFTWSRTAREFVAALETVHVRQDAA
jgi:glycosyltransferase involved in cell wall biosynthesis